MEKDKIIKKIFSKTVLQNILNNNDSTKLDTYLVEIDINPQNITNLEKYQKTYSFLKEDYRNEYFFKNEIVNNFLRSDNQIIEEQWIDNSRADLVILDNDPKVIEIKTNIDTLKRLNNQITDYFKAFDKVCVITTKDHIIGVLSTYSQSPVGVYVLDEKNTLHLMQNEQESTQDLSHTTIYKILRKQERKNILNQFYEELPETNDFNQFDIFLDLFKKIPMSKLYPSFVKALKQRKYPNFNSIKTVPYELRSLVYFSNLNTVQIEKLNKNLQTKKQ